MNDSVRKEFADTVEGIIDKIGLQQTIEMISDICYEKSAHIQDNWQDANTAYPWEKSGEKLFSVCLNDRFIKSL